MLDIFNIPGQQDSVKIFYAAGTTVWQTWTKPRGCKFIWMMCIGAGNGGLGMGTNTISANQGAGGGAVTRALFPANVLPDILFIQPGVGGTGGLSSTVGSPNDGGIGGRSYVSIVASSASSMNLVCLSGTSPGVYWDGEGAAGPAVAGLLSLGNFQTIAGETGTVGNKTPLTTTITCTGGGNFASISGQPAGGSIFATTISPRIDGGAIGGGNGGDGIWSWKPMFGLGGAGGGNNSAGTGGKGGNGGYGCGGGTGGYGNVAGGAGGNGGGGLVIIATF
jgi:hypothetical protein